MVEQVLRGASQAEVGLAVGLGHTQVTNELKAAQRSGVLEEVRDELLKSLARTPTVYNTIMAATPEDLQKNSKGYKLKLDAANDLNKGLASFRAETHAVTETKWTLESIASEKALGEEGPRDGYGVPIRKRIAFQPETVDVERFPPDSV